MRHGTRLRSLNEFEAAGAFGLTGRLKIAA